MRLSLGAEVVSEPSQDAHPQLQCALCLLQHCASAPNLITPLIQWLPPSVSPPMAHSSSQPYHFPPSVHQMDSSLLEAVLLSPPIAPCPPCQDLQPLSC